MTSVRLTLLALLLALGCSAQTQTLTGTVRDPQFRPVAGARVSAGQTPTLTDSSGAFHLTVNEPIPQTLTASAPGFAPVTLTVPLDRPTAPLEFRFTVAAVRNTVTVVADVEKADILFPDPAQRIFASQDLLVANPGRPGVPISIPGLPAETASSGIKAPQYFAPGVAGDHGEPIGQFFAVGTYLVPNNLSANAHGNGYADPNVLIPQVIESVQVDGGAFNVREGNHAVNLAAIYGFRNQLEPFATLTGDHRDLDLTTGFITANGWLAAQISYGNGFLKRLEHRKQYKLNGFRTFRIGGHAITLLGLAYYGSSALPGLIPLDSKGLGDTVDRRQRDQTHTGEFVVNDNWNLAPGHQLQLSSFFRTYNLSLVSNFGDGLIRQSEFRTVTGGNATDVIHLSDSFSILTGVDYRRDAPRRLNLDRYQNLPDSSYGPFDPVTASDVTIAFLSPYAALDGSLTRYLHFNLGFRRDQISFDNDDRLQPANSAHRLIPVNSPKGTVAFLAPRNSWLPNIAFSLGQAFHTNDPRIAAQDGTSRGTPVSRAHSAQLVVSKTIFATDFRLTLGRVTTEQSLGRLDADTGLQFDEGPSRNRYVAISARRAFSFGLLQASVSKADARDLSDGTPTPEAPRLILDFLGSFDRLPWRLHARAEYEQVGRRPLGNGFTSVPIREFRGSLFRRLGPLDTGVNFLIASGYTGQTLETITLPGSDDPLERVVGVRLPSYVSGSVTYHFGRHP